MWNHFDNDDDRINNIVEGDNNKMRIFCGAAQPDISKAVMKQQLMINTRMLKKNQLDHQ